MALRQLVITKKIQDLRKSSTNSKLRTLILNSVNLNSRNARLNWKP